MFFYKITLLLIALFFLYPSQSLAKRSFPQNYMMEKHGTANPFYCDLDDPIEEFACMAWDTSLGANIYYSEKSTFNKSQFDFLAAMAAMNILQQYVSGLRSMLYYKIGKGPYPHSVCLIQKRGACGNHQLLMEEILAHIGIKSRRVGVYMELDGKRLTHAMNEINLDGRWVLLDTTHATIYRPSTNMDYALSYADIIKLPEKERFDARVFNSVDVHVFTIMNQLPSSLSKETMASRNEQFAYLRDETKLLGVLYDGEGTILYDLSSQNVLEQLPNYIGSNSLKNSGVIGKVFAPNIEDGGLISIKVNVSGIGGCSNYGSVLVDDNGGEYQLDKGNNIINVSNGSVLSVKKEISEICYIVFSEMSLAK